MGKQTTKGCYEKLSMSKKSWSGCRIVESLNKNWTAPMLRKNVKSRPGFERSRTSSAFVVSTVDLGLIARAAKTHTSLIWPIYYEQFPCGLSGVKTDLGSEHIFQNPNHSSVNTGFPVLHIPAWHVCSRYQQLIYGYMSTPSYCCPR